MLHDDSDYAKMVLDDISIYADDIYVNLNDPTPEIVEIVLKHDNVTSTIETTNGGSRWNQGLQRDNTIRMLDDVKPDIVLFPDSDEIYPPNFWDQLRVFWEDEQKKTFWFRLLYLWGDEDHFRNDGLFKKIHHVRAFKWEPGITYLPRYAGYAMPTSFAGLPKSSRYHSTAPTLHYGYEKEENRIRKYSRANCDYCNPAYRKIVDKNMIIKDVPDDLKRKK